MATLFGTTGAKRSVAMKLIWSRYLPNEWINVPSVTMPSVPSAPMNNFVVSKPADDFRARLRV